MIAEAVTSCHIQGTMNMSLELLLAHPLSVSNVVSNPNMDQKHVAIHGELYLGAGCIGGTFIFLPKSGPFDGKLDGPIKIPDSGNIIAITDPELRRAFDEIPPRFGHYSHRYDAIIVGKVERKQYMAYNVTLTDLWMLTLQHYEPMPWDPDCISFRIIDFSKERRSAAHRTTSGTSGVPLLELVSS